MRITLAGAASAELFTDPSGAYAFAGLADGSYTVTPAKAFGRLRMLAVPPALPSSVQ